MKKSDTEKEQVGWDEYLSLQSELDEARRQHGIASPHKEGKISRTISAVLDKREGREKHAVLRKKYMILALLTGWMGGHRFYAKQYVPAVLYLALFWTGFPIAMTIVDLMIALPMKPDEEGKILL